MRVLFSVARTQNIVFLRVDSNEARASGFTTVSRNPLIGCISEKVNAIQATAFDILPCLKAEDSCSWFHERTYFIRFPF